MEPGLSWHCYIDGPILQFDVCFKKTRGSGKGVFGHEEHKENQDTNNA